MKQILADIADLIAGFAFKSKEFGENYPDKVIKIANIKPPRVEMDGVSSVDMEHYDKNKLSKYLVHTGDYVFAMTGATIGKIGRVECGEAYINQRVLLFKPHKCIDSNYLYYYLLQDDFYQYVINHIDSESAQPNISAKTVGKYEIDLPDLKRQQAIGKLLRSLDEKIELNERINDNLLQQLNTIFKHWFVDNPSLDIIEQVPLADLCLVVTKGTTPTTLGKPFVSEGINFIKAESILDNHAIDKGKFAFVDSETNDLLRRSIICSGDIVFTIAGTLGRFALIDESVLPANTNQAVAIIRANQSKVTPEYLYSFFLGNWHNDYYTKRIQQAVQANLSLGTIKSLPIPILSNKAMSEYLGIITPIIKMTKANELEITRLGMIRDALLPQLMSGELDISAVEL